MINLEKKDEKKKRKKRYILLVVIICIFIFSIYLVALVQYLSGGYKCNNLAYINTQKEIPSNIINNFNKGGCSCEPTFLGIYKGTMSLQLPNPEDKTIIQVQKDSLNDIYAILEYYKSYYPMVNKYVFYIKDEPYFKGNVCSVAIDLNKFKDISILNSNNLNFKNLKNLKGIELYSVPIDTKPIPQPKPAPTSTGNNQASDNSATSKKISNSSSVEANSNTNSTTSSSNSSNSSNNSSNSSNNSSNVATINNVNVSSNESSTDSGDSNASTNNNNNLANTTSSDLNTQNNSNSSTSPNNSDSSDNSNSQNNNSSSSDSNSQNNESYSSSNSSNENYNNQGTSQSSQSVNVGEGFGVIKQLGSGYYEARLHSAPNSSSSYSENLNGGTKVKIINENSYDYDYVEAPDGNYGYVYDDYIIQN